MLRAALVAVAVILGLVSMHVLDLHAPVLAAHAQMAAQTEAAEPAGAPAEAAVAVSSAETGAAAARPAHPVASSATPMGGDCPACLGGEWEAALGCAIVLMLMVLALVLPRAGLERRVVWLVAAARTVRGRVLAPAAPSLHALCVSRT